MSHSEPAKRVVVTPETHRMLSYVRLERQQRTFSQTIDYLIFSLNRLDEHTRTQNLEDFMRAREGYLPQ